MQGIAYFLKNELSSVNWQQRRPAGVIDYLLLLGLSAMFGASFLFTKVALQGLSPIELVSARLGIACLVVFVLMLVVQQALPSGSIWIDIFACAFFGNALPFCLISWAQVKVDAGITAIFMAIMPLATVALAHFFTHDEKLNKHKVVGVLLGLFGVTVLMSPLRSVNAEGQVISQLAIILAALCYAVNAILTRRLTGLPKISMITALMLSSCVLIAPVYAASVHMGWAGPARFIDTQSLLAVLILALGPTAFATLLILVIIDRQGASFLSQINFLVPLFGVFFGAVFLSERVPSTAWLALLLILTGIAAVRFGNRAT